MALTLLLNQFSGTLDVNGLCYGLIFYNYCIKNYHSRLHTISDKEIRALLVVMIVAAPKKNFSVRGYVETPNWYFFLL